MSKVLGAILVAAGIFFFGSWVGCEQGKQRIQLQWEQDKRAARELYDQLKLMYGEQEVLHRMEMEKISHELVEAKKDHENAVAGLRSDFDQRLLQSESRAASYRRQAEAGTSACRDLASHAARLDRSLEEGRGLVREFGETLRLRERELILLGDQILNERKLLEGSHDD